MQLFPAYFLLAISNGLAIRTIRTSKIRMDSLFVPAHWPPCYNEKGEVR